MSEQMKVVNTGGREIHMMGDYVGVCWNTTEAKITIEKDGKTYHATENVRSGEPYIAFAILFQHGDEWYEDEDSSVAGGLSVEAAEAVRDELTLAIQYLREQEVKDE